MHDALWVSDHCVAGSRESLDPLTLLADLGHTLKFLRACRESFKFVIQVTEPESDISGSDYEHSELHRTSKMNREHIDVLIGKLEVELSML